MKHKILEIVSEQQSPLFRIMSIYDDDNAKKAFANNISAFHVGFGYILSVAHNLRGDAITPSAINELNFQNEIIAKSNPSDADLFNKCYLLDGTTNKRYLIPPTSTDVQQLKDAFRRIGYDTRWISLYSTGICKPFLIVQFKNNEFYNDPAVTALFNRNHAFFEQTIGVHTFIIELELIKAYWSNDIAIYKVSSEVDKQITSKLPSVDISYEIAGISSSLYCLQGSPSGTNLGRMLNESRIEGLLDHHAVQNDSIGGNYIFEGFRYLLKGYFRFGSSGAPYLLYDAENDEFKVNAVQSEASPIQLTINNQMEGNSQYINAIASPLLGIQRDLESIINTSK